MHLGNTPRIASLRWSLLASMGLVPIACGGNTDRDLNPGTGGTTIGQGGRSAAAGTSSTTGGKGPLSKPPACTSPHWDPTTQLVVCQEGYSHRPSATRCEAPAAALPPGTAGAAGEAAAGGHGGQLPFATGHESCASAAGPDDSVCAVYAHGFCRTVMPSADCQGGCCYSGCVTDQDCQSGSICSCDSTRSPSGGECVPAGCSVDADCGDGYRCASADDLCGVHSKNFVCQTAEDQCTTTDDCDGRPCSTDTGLGEGRRCFTGTCGRPFLIEAEARMAPVVSGAAWLGHSWARPRVAHLTFAERAALADHWKKLGQMEHASIAAFARFSLQLLSLGAPPELLEACTQALADETAHTKLCFQIASAYGGCEVGPGALDIDGSLAVTSLADIVELVIHEGCFGETAAALDAFESASAATDPVIARAYAQIADDEQRHAELAFRFLRWALARGGSLVAQRIAASIAAPPTSHPATRAVTLPCLSALLGAMGPRMREGSSISGECSAQGPQAAANSP